MSIRVPCPCSFFAVYAVLVFCSSLHAILIPEILDVRASEVVGNETDRLALLEFKSRITHDPLGALGSWNESIHFCQWHGVTCSRRHRQRVTVLDLESFKLAGSIAPHIGNLSFLKVLNLQNNSFTHEIPSEIGLLRRLQVLALNNNSIGGEIPANISRCSNLIQIYLSCNQFAGRIPSEFGSFSKIEVLQLSLNDLTGSIPSSLGNLTSILQISLVYNNLNGSIPDTFGWLKNLGFLALGANKLTGIIPSSIFNISSIEIFAVEQNQIQGNIPLESGFTLPNLQYISIARNQMTGAIPPSISNASKLEVFQVGGNKLTGEVPDLEKQQMLSVFITTENSLGSGGYHDLNFLCSLTNATRLKDLDLNANNFGGLLPRCISNFSATLERLLLDGNKIVGSIPAGIGKFVNLQNLQMWDNQLSGAIPHEIGELQNLEILILFRNRLSGKIPPAIGQLQNLQKLNLGINKLTGNISPSYGNLKKLSELHLHGNFLHGSIPSSLGQCESLNSLALSNNNLSGIIPPQLMGLTSLSFGLFLSGNQLIGSLPIEVGKLINLEILDVSGNMLEGEIPSTIGSCIRLEKLGMGGNFFRGSIPSSLSSLRGLTDLDLSQNNISGEIPKFFIGFELLQNLNLSFNDFEGMVPTEGVFKNASATSVLGNSKLCGGISEFKLPKCGSKISKRKKLPLGLKLVISIVSALVGLALALSILFLCWVRKRKEKSNSSSSMNSLSNLSYQNLYNATDGFSSANLIGAGTFGSVYKGILDDGRTTIAVKVFNLHHQGSSKSFIAECKVLRNIRHRNLIKVLTVCSGVDYQGNDFKALIYEFMHNGSLEQWLYPITREDETDQALRNLNLLQRLNIAIDVASALNYLHHDCQLVIAHCDLKPGNVLLDDDMTAHVGDFGLAKFLPSTHSQTSSFGVKGSIGYIAPEYGLGSAVSTNGDVYSFGILLLELVIRKKPSDIMFEGDMNLHNFARAALPNHMMDIIDLTLLNDFGDLAVTGNQRLRQISINRKIECLISMVRIGVACSMKMPQDRMNMTNVVHELQSIKDVLLRPRTLPNVQRGRQNS